VSDDDDDFDPEEDPLDTIDRVLARIRALAFPKTEDRARRFQSFPEDFKPLVRCWMCGRDITEILRLDQTLQRRTTWTCDAVPGHHQETAKLCSEACADAHSDWHKERKRKLDYFFSTTDVPRWRM